MTIKQNTKKRAPLNRVGYDPMEKTTQPFTRAFRMLSIENRAIVSRVIRERCNLSQPYFSMKKTGVRGLTEYEEMVVRTTFKCFNIDAFTGETIQN